MGFHEEAKKKDQGISVPAALAIGAVVALIKWWRGGSFSNALAVGGAAAALIIWLISKRICDSEGSIQYLGATTSSSQVESIGDSDRKEELQRAALSIAVGSSVVLGISKLIGGYVIAFLVAALAAATTEKWLREGGGSDEKKQFLRTSISLAVGTTVAWGISDLIGGYVIALMVGAVLAWKIANWLQKLEKERKRKLEEERKRWSEGAKSTALAIGGAVGAAAALAACAWGISKSLSSAEEEKKMMKAPGRDQYMVRKDFEASPSTYFRELRGKY